MERLVDSHCHLDSLDLTVYNGQIENAIAAAREQGVCHILCVAVNLAGIANILHLAQTYVDVTASVGVHPNEQSSHEPSIEELCELASNPRVIAIGETGLDYYRCEGDMTWQHRRFRRHIAAAKELKKPLIIHTRQAREDTLKILKEENAEQVGGVLHCFTEDWNTAQQVLDLGFYISFSGILTFKNAKELQEIAKKIPLNRILIETDSPYLAPVPYRGKPNEPAYVRYVAKYLANLREIEFNLIAEQTTLNFFNLFAHHFKRSVN